MSEWPMRDITDPRMLRALAHPIRISLLNALVLHGPATATELAERVDDSPANCSWHLRQLAKFGFIEEAADLPRQGRNRPWRWVPTGNRWRTQGVPPELEVAGRQTTATLLGYELAQLRSWIERRSQEDPRWVEASFTNQSLAWLTLDELAEIGKKVQELILQHHERFTDPARRPEGARPIRFIAWGIPAADS